jgi:hypothetical protein
MDLRASHAKHANSPMDRRIIEVMSEVSDPKRRPRIRIAKV